jgi:nucleotide-binding universal stress UspA family protein
MTCPPARQRLPAQAAPVAGFRNAPLLDGGILHRVLDRGCRGNKGMDRCLEVCYEAGDAAALGRLGRSASLYEMPLFSPERDGTEGAARMKILVAFEGSNVTKAALEVAVKHARAFEGELLLVWSMAKGDEDQQDDIQTAEKSLAYWKDHLEGRGLVCQTHLLIRGLEAGEDLVRFASEHDVAEIVIGIRRRSKVGKLLFGSTAQYVILNAPCPVVTVR